MTLSLLTQKHATCLSLLWTSVMFHSISPLGPGSIWLDLYLKGILSFDAFEKELFFPTAIF